MDRDISLTAAHPMQDTGERAIKIVQDTYERWGREDPFYAVLTSSRYRGDQCDQEKFYRSGVDEVNATLARARAYGIEPIFGRALDFGCGVGRLSFGLAAHFEHTTGVDIAQSMVDVANAQNTRPEHVNFVANPRSDLGLFESDTFDLVFTHITLQHIPPEAIERYIAEFFRITQPGGVIIFQLPDGELIEPGSIKHWLYNLRRRHVRRLRKRLQGTPPYEMHWVARSRIEAWIDAAGGTLVAAHNRNEKNPGSRPNYQYFCRA